MPPQRKGWREIAEDAASGQYTTRQLAERHDCSQRKVVRALKEAGLTGTGHVRSGKRRPVDEDRDTALFNEFWNEYATVNVLCSRHGLTRCVVEDIIRVKVK